ncbi:phosphoribomutase PRM15 NDAI_0K00410 [Naumovozyma dairenensis CBS 421]|uniref:phosphopentomutase n=1 Tax=Naumovozyma dairenensis (strain ATCC 10597 / BCRC 20456 / CBS 421 / NBRC 0211 / NRRL Y-12639) TaxID=1071378 RepID=G0WHH1_NAUDC|nr:hypothetical protein NDAI_0K00410 [Naumovozyma dairenensis CBS 421]CCD27232.1 hypothetical protein NDAI_0K00410 [Naumovozyma dairenensis CBS 421]
MSSIPSIICDDCPANLRENIDLWLRQDKCEETRNEVIQLCKDSNWIELHKRFDSRIVFGTAGLRSRMEAGFSRMNPLVILQASQGLAKYIKAQFPTNLTAVVGHDHRFHSKQFAMITASVFLRVGFKVYYLNPEDSFVHTPLVPFSVNHLNASIGVMITASHNPKMDNGYKVYYSNGCQIIPPHDKNIAATIDENLEPWSSDWNWDSTFEKNLKEKKLVYVREEMTNKYLQAMKDILVSSSISRPNNNGKKPWFVYTPMHGVGYNIFTKISKNILHYEENMDYFVVKEQMYPDPAFPTVSFPNPEEKGALSLATKLAEENNISLVIANDPDADRFSVASKNEKTGQWQQLSGNEIGFLFASFELEKYMSQDIEWRRTHPLAMINSTVSSQMIKKMAQVESFHYEDTLTGFKWIGNRALDLQGQGYYVPFGFEEAIGYMFPTMVTDKDGVSAAVVFLLAYSYWLNNDGSYPFDILEKGFKKFGFFKEYNGYYIYDDPKTTKQIFDFVRYQYDTSGNPYPKNIGKEFKIEVFRDLTTGYQSNTIDNLPNLPVDPHSEMITIEAVPKQDIGKSKVRFTMRGSGTEPKLKLYIEAVADNEKCAIDLAYEMWNVLKKEWIRPDVTGLTTTF